MKIAGVLGGVGLVGFTEYDLFGLGAIVVWAGIVTYLMARK